jgi:hypothetical protein
VNLTASASLVDVAFAACTALARAGETAVLCGGSAASYYVPEVYRSLDIDFVPHVQAARHIVDRALASIGYVRGSGGPYVHATLPYAIELPMGPLAIGREYVTSWRTDRRGDLLLHVFTATDVVRDRFLHYWAWGDPMGLEVALAVTRAHRGDVDLDGFRRWTERERAADPSYDAGRVEQFLRRL